jgi:hypothetical protein
VLEPEALSREELVALVRDQGARLAAQDALLAAQDVRLADQAVELERLRSELERIKRLISRNSGNSSMPPSTDDLPGRGRPVKPVKGSAKRKRGKQAGAHLPWLSEADVEVVNERPQGSCDGCGTDLAEAFDEGVDRACQITDVPLVTAKTTEYRMHQVRCPCGRAHVAEPPSQAGTGNTRVYGPNLRALVVYLLVFQHVPVERCVRLIADLTGATVSAGFVHKALARCAAILTDVMKSIKALITLAAVVHFDETTLRAGKAGIKQYVWSASTALYSFFALGRRTGKQFRSLDIGPQFHGVAVHDRYVVYDSSDSFGTGVQHQLCCSHLLRDLADAAESYPDAVWPIQCARALRGLIHASNVARAAGDPEIRPKCRDQLIDELRNGVLVGLKEVPRIGGPKDKQRPARSLLEDLDTRQADVLRFCYDTTIPPTNNLAERDLRPNKTQQKISGRLTSDEATNDRLTIRGYISTAVKHGLDAMTVLHDALTGNPWTPAAAQAAAALCHA